MARKSRRTFIALVSQASGHRRVTRKNALNSPHKLEFKKYDPLLRKVTVYKEVTKNLGRNVVKARKK